jgi:NADH-quinone oxidoreductase subunit G
VKVTAGSEKDPRPMPKLVPACITAVQDGMIVENTVNEDVLETRKGIVEFLLLNHPLDCPVCDQAGECHLQDFSFEHGVSSTRTVEERNTFEPTDLGPNIQLHMNRCILCYRCVYTADQITDGRVHGVMNRGDHAEISTYIEKAIDNDFSGNMVDVCPVGALTSKPYAFMARPWELESTETIDLTDGIGSNVKMDSRFGVPMRITPKLNEEINEEWHSSFKVSWRKGVAVNDLYINPEKHENVQEQVNADSTLNLTDVPKIMLFFDGDMNYAHLKCLHQMFHFDCSSH